MAALGIGIGVGYNDEEAQGGSGTADDMWFEDGGVMLMEDGLEMDYEG